MRSIAGTLILLGIAGGLAAALWFTKAAPTTPASVTYPLLGAKSVRDARRIAMQNDIEGNKIVFERNGQRWQIVEPLKDLASSAFIDSLLRSYDSAQLVHAFDPEQIDAKVLAETGLDKPRSRIAFTFDGETVELEFGLDGITGQDLFVRRSGKIWRGGLGLYSVLRATLSDLRERIIFQNERASKLTIARKLSDGKVERFVLEFGGDAPRILEPILARTEPQTVGMISAQILGMRADSFLQGSLNPRPDPDFVIEVEGDAGKEKVALWGKAGETLIGQHTPRNVEFTIGLQRYIGTLETPLENLRSRLVLAVAPEQILRIEIDPGPGHGKASLLVPALESGTFRLQQPVVSETDPVAVSQLVSALAELKAERFVNQPSDLAKLGLDADALRVTVVGQFSLRPTTLLFGKDEGESSWCKRSDEPFAMLVPRTSVTVIREGFARLCSKLIQRPSGAAFQLFVQKGQAKKLWKKSTDDGAWRQEGETAPVPDLQEVVDLLSELKAAQVLDPDVVGPLTDPVSVELRSPAGDPLCKLELFARKDKVLARTDRIQVVFELKSRDARSLLALVQ